VRVCEAALAKKDRKKEHRGMCQYQRQCQYQEGALDILCSVIHEPGTCKLGMCVCTSTSDKKMQDARCKMPMLVLVHAATDTAAPSQITADHGISILLRDWAFEWRLFVD
jgi:hypothetical protein